MNKTEFLDVIQKEIAHLPSAQRRQIISHFNTQLIFHETHPDKPLGEPEEELRKYLNTSKITSIIPSWLLMIALLIISPFIAYGFLIASLLLLLAVLIFVLIPASGTFLWLEGMRAIFTSVPQDIMLSDKLCQIGIGLMAFAAGSFIIIASYTLYSKLIPWLIHKLPEIKRNIENRRSR